MPFFSVIIPTYDRADLLGEALDSVFAQEFGDFEVIVVDDGSADRTSAVLAGYRDRIKVLYQENRGPGAARNYGVRNASALYVVFLDSDDVFFPWTLKCYASLLRGNAQLSLLIGNVISFRSKNDLARARLTDVPLHVNYYDDFLTAGQGPIFFGSYFVISRNAFLKAGGFEEEIRVFEDQDFGLRIGTIGKLAAISVPFTIGYRQTDASLTRDSKEIIKGMNFMIARELQNGYPGGNVRKWQRRNYIAFSVRSASIALLKQANFREAWSLYRRSFVWHLRLARLRYVAGFPLLLFLSVLRR